MPDAKTFWDRIARKYAANPIKNIAAYHQTIDTTRAHLSKDDRVLEVGCGTGSTALLLAPDVALITASDISSEMIEIGREKAAAQKIANVDFVCATPDDDAFPEAPYDAVLAFNFLHLMPDVPGTLRRLGGMIRPGGLLISKSASLGGQRFFLKPVLLAMQLVGKAPSGVSFFTTRQLGAMIADAGFEIVESSFHGDLRPYIVARKK